MAPEIHQVDRTGWPAGPWDQEPDRVDWKQAGLPCLILRGPVGALCGYAAVPPGHTLHGAAYDTADIEAHGGLTYSGPCSGHICHVPLAGEPDDVWWFGFDCAHAGDVVPALLASMQRYGMGGGADPLGLGRDSYKDLAYVTAEVNHLAEQLAAARPS